MAFAFRVEQVEGLLRRNEQERGVFDGAFGPVMQRVPRFIEGMTHVMIKLGVLLRRDLALGTHPQGRRAVQRFRRGIFFAFDGIQDHRQRDVVGIGFDDLAQTLGLQELLRVLLHMQGDARTAWRIRRLRNRESALAVTAPDPAV
jgi:hypothetical protein